MNARLTAAALATSLVAATALPGLATADDADHPRAPASEKSGAVATGLAVGTTAAGFGLLALSVAVEDPFVAAAGTATVIVGPSAGHIYAGEGVHATATSAIRAGGALAFTYGALGSLCFADDCGDQTGANVLMVAGLGTYAAATLYDFYDAHRAAGRANERNAFATASLLSTPDGRTAPGLVVAGQF